MVREGRAELQERPLAAPRSGDISNTHVPLSDLGGPPLLQDAVMPPFTIYLLLSFPLEQIPWKGRIFYQNNELSD